MKNIDTTISTNTLFKIALGVFIVWFLYSIKIILAIFFSAILLNAALDSWIDKLTNKKFPRFLAVVIIYVITLSFITFLVSVIIPPVNEQARELIKNFPQFYEYITNSLTVLLPHDNQGIATAPFFSSNVSLDNIIDVITNVFGGLVSFGLMLVITFYMSIEENATKRTLLFLLPKKHHEYTLILFSKVQEKIGLWLQGQLIISFTMSIITYIGLSILGIRYALVLALIAGLAEFVPYIGPITSGVFAVLIGFSISPLTAILVIILYAIVQQLQTHVLIPQIMKRAVGLSPIISIFALLIGVKVGGVLGAILAIPTAAALSVFVEEFYKHKEHLS